MACSIVRLNASILQHHFSVNILVNIINYNKLFLACMPSHTWKHSEKRSYNHIIYIDVLCCRVQGQLNSQVMSSLASQHTAGVGNVQAWPTTANSHMQSHNRHGNQLLQPHTLHSNHGLQPRSFHGNQELQQTGHPANQFSQLHGIHGDRMLQPQSLYSNQLLQPNALHGNQMSLVCIYT